jgi:hypothetical protein
MKISETKIEEIQEDLKGELSEDFFQKCSFCEKTVELVPFNRKIIEKFNDTKNFYCPFCIRNNFYTKNRYNVLCFSFRGIIGYFYYFLYHNNKIWFSEIEDYIDSHVQTGLLNPLFVYDQENLIWFVDFSKIGKTKRKVLLEEVNKTIINILVCFNLHDNIPLINMVILYNKFQLAFLNFYEKRKRPEKKRILIPTLSGCIEGKKEFFEKCRNFTKKDMIFKNYY